MKYYENSSVYQYTWEQVVQGFWNRYPNPQSKHVLTEDTVFREVKDGKLYSKRLLFKTNGLPKWGERLINCSQIGIIEESILDPKERLFTTYTWNFGLAKILTIIEKVTYKVSPENGAWTVANRSAWFESRILGLKKTITNFGIERFRKNCKRMTKGFNFVLSSMFPHIIINKDEATDPLITCEKLIDVAKTASYLAKNNTMFASCESKNS